MRVFFLFGYLSFPGLFAAEAEAITEAFEAVWTEHGGGHNQQPHDHKQNSALLPFIDQHPYLCALLAISSSSITASFGGDTCRRMFTINLQQRFREEDEDMLRECIDSLARFLE